MPPKAKFTRDEIIKASLAIVKAEGFKALTARALGAKLGSSARPIFTVFDSMEEVQQAVLDEAKRIYKQYVECGLKETLPFKGVGIQYILFAMEEPKLFQLLFMKEQELVPNLSGVLPLIEESYDDILYSIQSSYALDANMSKKLYHHLWIYTHGIASLCATKMCCFTAEEMNTMMTEVFVSLLKNMKGDQKND